jgi:hypothetical protein
LNVSLNKLFSAAFLCLTLILSFDLTYAFYVYYGNYLSALSFKAVLVNCTLSESNIISVFNLTNNSFFTVRVLAIKQEIYINGNYLVPSTPSEEWVSFYSNPIEVSASKAINGIIVNRSISGISANITGSLHFKVSIVIQVLPLITHATRSFEFYG